MILNTKNVNQRDMILFNQPYDDGQYLGGIRRFRELSKEDYDGLLSLGVIDPMDRQNDAPPINEIMAFIEEHPNFYAHGYAVSPKRDDYRVSLEGVECDGEYSLEDVIDFFRVFRYPDEYDVMDGKIYCWYD